MVQTPLRLSLFHMTKRWKLRLVSVLFALVAAVLIFEIGLRVAGIYSPAFMAPDEYRGFSLRPGAAGWYKNEGGAYVQINSDGLRDRERTKEKPQNTFRVAVLGDSMIEALQVPLDQTASAILENKLQQCPSLNGRKVEVINFGVSSYGTAQELLTLRHKVWDYSPDLVLLAFTATNDIRDNSRALAHDSDMRAYFVYQNDQLVLDNSFLQSPRFQRQQSFIGKSLFWLKEHSRIAGVISDMRSALRAKREERDPKMIDSLNLVYKEPADPVWTDAWGVTEGTIELMRDEVEKRGARFIVATLTTDRQVQPDPSVRNEFAKSIGVSDLFYPDRRIKALGDRDGFTVVNLGQPLQEYAEKNGVFLHGFGNRLGSGHWNAEGNRVVGERLSAELCKSFKR